MKDPKKERGGVVPTAVPKTPALVKRGAAAMIAVGLVGCGGSSESADYPPQQPDPPPQVVPPQAPPEEGMTPPQEPPQAAPPPQAPPPQAPPQQR